MYDMAVWAYHIPSNARYVEHDHCKLYIYWFGYWIDLPKQCFTKSYFFILLILQFGKPIQPIYVFTLYVITTSTKTRQKSRFSYADTKLRLSFKKYVKFLKCMPKIQKSPNDSRNWCAKWTITYRNKFIGHLIMKLKLIACESTCFHNKSLLKFNLCWTDDSFFHLFRSYHSSLLLSYHLLRLSSE